MKNRFVGDTYKGKSAVGAPAYLRLVDIDEYARVAKRSTATITGYFTFFRPTNGLLVNQ